MNISGELLAELGRIIQNDWYERLNMLVSDEKNLWDTMTLQKAELSATMLSRQMDDSFSRHISMFRNLYNDIHKLAYPFSSRNSGGADESEMAPDALIMPPFSSISGPKTVLTSNTQAKSAENPVANLYPAKFSSIDPDTTKASTHPSKYTEQQQYSNPDAKWDGHPSGHISVEPEHKGTRQDTRKTSDSGKVSDGNLQNPTEDQPGNHTAEKRKEMGSLHPEKFTEIKGWNQLGEIFQNIERERPGFYLNDEQPPGGKSIFPHERSDSEKRISEQTSIPAGKDTVVGKLFAVPSAASAPEEPGIQEVSKQLPAEVDFEEHKGTRQDTRNTSDSGKVSDGNLQNPTEDQPGNHTAEKRKEMGSLHPEKFTEIKGWNQLGEIFHNIERERPGFYLNDEQPPGGKSIFPHERSDSEKRISEQTSIPAGKDTVVGKLSTVPSAASAPEESGILKVPKQLPAEVDFEELFTEMQWRLNLEYKRYYGH